MRLAATIAAVLSALATSAAALPLTAFYVPWEKPALASLKAHVGEIDVFSPMWGSLVSPTGKIVWEDDPVAHVALAGAARRPKVLPLISNAHDDIWDVAAAEAVILQRPAGQAFAQALVKQAEGDRLAGFVMDFENLTPKATAGYPTFLARLRKTLNAQHLEVWVTTTLSDEDGLPRDLSKDVDAVVLMAYDQCWATSTPGPIAADAWLAANLTAKLAGQDPGRFVVALASYGYDWPAGKTAKVVSAAGLAARGGPGVVHDPGSNPHYSSRVGGVRHDTWWSSGEDVARQRAMLAPLGLRGVALWRMGLEDPALWTATAAAPAVPQGPAQSCEPLKP